jgi:hypothetical protein
MGGWIKVDVGPIDSDSIRASGRPVGDTFCEEGVSDPASLMTPIDANANAMCEMDDHILELRRCFHDGPSMVSIFTDRGRLKQNEIVSGEALESAEVLVGSFVDVGDQVAVIGENGAVSVYRWDEHADGTDAIELREISMGDVSQEYATGPDMVLSSAALFSSVSISDSLIESIREFLDD